MTAKPTPGPWKWDGELPKTHADGDWANDAPWLVDASGQPILAGEISCENLANAALIAEAWTIPYLKAVNAALLAMLDSTALHLSNLLTLQHVPPSMTPAVEHSIHEARAAIRAAETTGE